MFWKLAARDLAIAGATTAAWWAFVHLTFDATMIADLTGVLLGLAFGACSFLAHEWGHWLGALASSSAVHPPSRLSSVYLFSYDSISNSKRQFLVMSFGGFLVTGASLWAVYALLPEAAFATRVARGAVLFLASLTVFLEIPIVIVSLFRKSLPPVEVFARQTVGAADDAKRRAAA